MRSLILLLLGTAALIAGEAGPGLLFSCPVPQAVDDPPQMAFIGGRLWYGSGSEVVGVDPATRAEVRHGLALSHTNNHIESRVLGGTATRMLVRIDLFDGGDPRGSGILVVDPANGAVIHERWCDGYGSIAEELLDGKPAWWDQSGFHVLDPETGASVDSARIDDLWRTRVMVRGGQAIMRGEHALHRWKPGGQVVSRRWDDPAAVGTGPLVGVNAVLLGDMWAAMGCLDDGRVLAGEGGPTPDPRLILFTPELVPQWLLTGVRIRGNGGDLVFAQRDVCLVALEAATGRVRWLTGLIKSDHGDQGLCGTTMLGGYALVASDRGLLVLAAADGRPLLECELKKKKDERNCRRCRFALEGDLLAVSFETSIEVYRLPPPDAPAVKRTLGRPIVAAPHDTREVELLALGEREAALARLRSVAGDAALQPSCRSEAAWWLGLLAPAAAVSADDGSLIFTMPPKEAIEVFRKRLSAGDATVREAAMALLAQADDRVIAKLAAAPPSALNAAQRKQLTELGKAATERLKQFGLKP